MIDRYAMERLLQGLWAQTWERAVAWALSRRAELERDAHARGVARENRRMQVEQAAIRQAFREVTDEIKKLLQDGTVPASTEARDVVGAFLDARAKQLDSNAPRAGSGTMAAARAKRDIDVEIQRIVLRPKGAFPAAGPTINIHAGATVGSVNTGSIGTLDVVIQQIRENGNEALARALDDLAKAIGGSSQLQPADREAAIEHLGFVAEQIAKTPAERRPSVVRTAVAALGTVLSVSSDCLQLLDAFKPMLFAALKLPVP